MQHNRPTITHRHTHGRQPRDNIRVRRRHHQQPPLAAHARRERAAHSPRRHAIKHAGELVHENHSRSRGQRARHAIPRSLTIRQLPHHPWQQSRIRKPAPRQHRQRSRQRQRKRVNQRAITASRSSRVCRVWRHARSQSLRERSQQRALAASARARDDDHAARPARDPRERLQSAWPRRSNRRAPRDREPERSDRLQQSPAGRARDGHASHNALTW